MIAASTGFLHSSCTARRNVWKNPGNSGVAAVCFEDWPDDGAPTNGELALGEFGGK
jgi:hypothetical protein